MVSSTCNIPEPTNLKEFLDLLYVIDNSGLLLGYHVAEKIKKRLNDHFVDNKDHFDDFNQYLGEVFDNVEELRKALLKNPEQYGNYNINQFSDSDECVSRCADILVKWLPKLHSEMLYIYFQTATECNKECCCGKRNGAIVPEDESSKLHTCLTGTSEKNDFLLSKGFKNDELKDGNRSHLLYLYTGINILNGGPLDKIQFGLFLLDQEFQDSNLASSLLFLEEFCKEVEKKNNGVFSNAVEKPEILDPKMSEKCEKLNDNIKLYGGALINALYPQTNLNKTELREGAIEGAQDCQGAAPGVTSCRNFYSGKLKPGAAEKYAEWIQKHADSVIKKLQELHSGSSSCKEGCVKNTCVPGPFKYGFAFKEDLTDQWIYSNIQAVVEKLKKEKCKTSHERLLKHYEEDKKKQQQVKEVAESQDTRVEIDNNGRIGGTNSESAPTQATVQVKAPAPTLAPEAAQASVPETVQEQEQVSGPAAEPEPKVSVTSPQNIPEQNSEAVDKPSEPRNQNPDEISGAKLVEEPPVSLLRDNNLVSEVELSTDVTHLVPQLPQNSSESSPSRLQGSKPAEGESSAMQLPLMPWVLLALLVIRKIF